MRNSPRQHNLDRTQAISEKKHLSGGRITSAMCRSAVNRALSSAIKTPAGLRILCPNPPPPIWWTAKPAKLSIKSHPYKKCTTHYTRTSQSTARWVLPMNTSPPEHWQASFPCAYLLKGLQGVLVAHAAWRVRTESSHKISKYPFCSAPSTLSLSFKGWPNQ
jgi:hypothetical protein